ncbi:MAG: AAA-like domain-containing protein [Candidatus Sumerlaeota bacterium]|nr:AAA-like domain-containing protein [Candidatus Sumerlaeota bacterium]
MKKFFNVAGPCFPSDHYMIPAQARCAALMPLVEQKTYFCIHAPRQSGKTTLLKDFVRTLNESEQYHGLYCSLERAQGELDVDRGIPLVLDALREQMEIYRPFRERGWVMQPAYANSQSALKKGLMDFCALLDKPLVVMFDEADCLSGPTLISFLRQLRDGYVNRDTAPFVHSLALVGLTNIRDYKGQIRKDSETLRSASPFNIVTEALTIRDFTREEIVALYSQHTEATGQIFPEEVIEAIFIATCGQPWLVNAVAREIVAKILGNDPSQTITPAHAGQAIQNIILRRDTHIDSLMERLRDDRIRRIVEPMITGAEREINRMDDDFQYASDLGLVKLEDGALKPANPIYGEVILRTLNLRIQDAFAEGQYPYALPRYIEGGAINMRKLLEEFQQFWRENSAIWGEMALYKEAAPHLILTAFLQRVVNMKGKISREFAAGRGRMDICIHFQGRAYPIEIKTIRESPKKAIEKGMAQLRGYMDTSGASEGWLVAFDQRPRISWKKKIYWETHTAPDGAVIHCVGC